jgi:C-terminal processing protease CtpA/Prc
VRITIAKWLTPNEKTIHEIGLTPDVYVTCEGCLIGRDDETDLQLLAAVDTLMAMMEGSPIPTSMPSPTPGGLVTPVPTP